MINQFFYKIWYDKSVNFIKDLINKNGELLSYEQFIDKYQIQTNFLEFYGIINIVRNFIRISGIDLNNAPLTNCYFPFNIKGIIKNKKGCTEIYNILNKNSIVPKSQLRWNTVFENVNINWNNIYNIPAKCCNNTKLH